jgi:hypothetical protein
MASGWRDVARFRRGQIKSGTQAIPQRLTLSYRQQFAPDFRTRQAAGCIGPLRRCRSHDLYTCTGWGLEIYIGATMRDAALLWRRPMRRRDTYLDLAQHHAPARELRTEE